jgi:argininosuccinate lyase
MAGMWKGLSVTRGRYEEALKGDFLLATELADYLALKGVPFREAHHVVGRLVKDCEEAGTDFSSLTVEILKKAHADFEEDALDWLVPESAAERRVSKGGTAQSEIARQVAILRGGI